jgi:hypothetical protein
MFFNVNGFKPVVVILTVLIGSTTFPAASVHATEVFKTGNSLKADCDRGATKDASGFLVRGYCVGYVKGIADAMSYNTLNGFKACMLSGLLVSQVTGIVRQYLNANPQSLHLAASGLVPLSLATAFPCQK